MKSYNDPPYRYAHVFYNSTYSNPSGYLIANVLAAAAVGKSGEPAIYQSDKEARFHLFTATHLYSKF
jgi:hypothetical protein